jgi:hypothetical protein
MSDLEETGAIDYYLIEFRGKEINGELVPRCSILSIGA